LKNIHPIGVFDSGYGGLTVLKEIVRAHPQYDYVYLGDNARAPYGTRSYETVHKYTLEAVQWFFEQGSELVILACNTASAKALRTIQQRNLPNIAPNKRVLGVIRPVTETVGRFSNSKHVGILGTPGTINSQSYPIEINKFFPDIRVSQEACPLWVPLVENNEHLSDGADYFIKKHLDQLFAKDPYIDTMVLGCTHYPLLIHKIQKYLPAHVSVISQGEIVANSLTDYLKRHADLEAVCTKGGNVKFCTTDIAESFEKQAGIFWGQPITAEQVKLS
jgi:glutamate racemase